MSRFQNIFTIAVVMSLTPAAQLTPAALTGIHVALPSPAPMFETERRTNQSGHSVSAFQYEWTSKESRDCAVDPTLAATRDIVVTEAGLIRGTASDAVYVFKGIPYAAPPVGDHRWQPPRPAHCWTGVRDATSFGPVCAQVGALPGTTTAWFGNEDCLTLNIWSPMTPPAPEGFPVLVFIHGGGNTRGAGSASVSTSIPSLGPNVQDGRRLAETGPAVVITLNYRLGFLGWLAHPALSKAASTRTSGNYGTMDQVAALQWVRRNIASFGGDPERVLVFGQSAGARDVCTLVASTATRGLFSRAGFISNSCENFPTLTEAETVGEQYAAQLGCAAAPNVPACLRAAPTELAVRTTVVRPPRLQGFQLGPIADGAILIDQPLALFRSPFHRHVPVLISSTANEAAFSLFPAYWPGPIATAADYVAAINTLTPSELSSEIQALYPVTNYPTPRAALTELLSDAHLVCPARRTARTFAQWGPPVWRAIWMHTASNGPLRPFGAGHVTDLPYWFDTLWQMPSFVPSASEAALAASMSAYIVAFADTGDPNTASAGGWPRYDETTDAELWLDDTILVASGFRNAFCDFWDTRMPPPGYDATRWRGLGDQRDSSLPLAQRPKIRSGHERRMTLYGPS